MKELEMQGARGQERDRVPVSGSGNGSEGKSWSLLRYVEVLGKVVLEPPGRAEEWPFYFRHVETLFERYEVPECYQARVVCIWLLKAKVKGRYFLPEKAMEKYEVAKEWVLSEYGVIARKQSDDKPGDKRGKKQRDKDWERKMEQKWQLGERIPEMGVERLGSKISSGVETQTERVFGQDVIRPATGDGSPVTPRIIEVQSSGESVEEIPVISEAADDTRGKANNCASESPIRRQTEGVSGYGVKKPATRPGRGEKREFSFGEDEGASSDVRFVLGGRKPPHPPGEKFQGEVRKERGSVSEMAVVRELNEIASVTPRDLRVLCLGEDDTPCRDAVTREGSERPTGEASEEERISLVSVRAEVSRPSRGEEEFEKDPSCLQVRSGKKEKQRKCTLRGVEERNAVLRKAGDQNGGSSDVSDRAGSKVRSGECTDVCVGRLRSSSLPPLGSERIRGVKGGCPRTVKVRHPEVASQSCKEKKASVKSRRAYMRGRKRLCGAKERGAAQSRTRRLKDAEIRWRGIARDFRRRGFRGRQRLVTVPPVVSLGSFPTCSWGSWR